MGNKLNHQSKSHHSSFNIESLIYWQCLTIIGPGFNRNWRKDMAIDNDDEILVMVQRCCILWKFLKLQRPECALPHRATTFKKYSGKSYKSKVLIDFFWSRSGHCSNLYSISWQKMANYKGARLLALLGEHITFY